MGVSIPAPNRVDGTRPDAPDLAALGPHPVGVARLTLVNPGQIDVRNATSATGPLVDRVLPTEVWYPAAPGTPPGTTYDTILRDGVTPIRLHGAACRDATPEPGHYPLVILSHGYPGNRFLMSHLAENLASKGYVVASLDHPGSTYDDQAAFGETLMHRPRDQKFAIDALAGADHPVAALIDTQRVGVIGYSMGGYGALVLGGAGITHAAVVHPDTAPFDILACHLAGSPAHEALPDPRIRCIIAFGPWGRQRGLWDAAGLAGLRVPTLIVAGSVDEVSGYADGMRLIFAQSIGTDRHLLTFMNAGHNAAAPIPAPAESWAMSPHLDFIPFQHYADKVWDTVRMNGIGQHFSTAFLGLHLKDQTAMHDYLGPDAVASGLPDTSEWPGFAPGTAVGLRFETLRKDPTGT